MYTSNFLRGFGRALDIRGSLRPRYARRRAPYPTDEAAVASDWAAVWSDLGRAYTTVVQRDAGAAAHGG